MISTDAARLDRSAAFAHQYVCFFVGFVAAFNHNRIWVGPVQIAIGVGLLIGNVSRYFSLVSMQSASIDLTLSYS